MKIFTNVSIKRRSASTFRRRRAPIRIASGRTSVSVAEDRSLTTIASVSLAKSAEPKTSRYLRKPWSIVPRCLAPRFPLW